MTKIAKLETYLNSGAEVTAKQITKMFGLQNPTAAIHALRSNGLRVYSNKAVLSNGTKTTKYGISRQANRNRTRNSSKVNKT